MSQTPVKKNFFQISQEVQEEFANGLAGTMASLSQKQGDVQNISLQMPFSAASGREFSGANMVRLMLTSLEKGYTDNRWMSFRQVEQFQRDNPDMNVHVRKGEKGTKILFPQEVFFVIGQDGQRETLTQERLAEIQRLRDAGGTEDVPEVHRGLLFYPYTVFNVQQIEGFPDKENPAPVMSNEEKQEFVDRFVASSGVHVSYTNFGAAHYSQDTDRVIMPGPDRYDMSAPLAMSAAKLREFFHATGHPDRENRLTLKGATLKPYALEEMRAELFSIMAGHYLGLPVDAQNTAAHVRTWNEKFTGDDATVIFQAATEAGKILTTMHQFKEGEIPKAKWFPPENQWEALRNAQLDSNDKYSAISLLQKALPILQSKFETYELGREVDQTIQSAQSSFGELQSRLEEVRQIFLSDHFSGNIVASSLAERIDKLHQSFGVHEAEDMRNISQQTSLLKSSSYILETKEKTKDLAEKSVQTLDSVLDSCAELDNKLTEVHKSMNSYEFKEDIAAKNIAADIDDFNYRFYEYNQNHNMVNEKNSDDIHITDTDLINLIKESIPLIEKRYGEDHIPKYGMPYSPTSKIIESYRSETISLIERYKKEGDGTLLTEKLRNFSNDAQEDDYLVTGSAHYISRVEQALGEVQKHGIRLTLHEEKSSLEASLGEKQTSFEQAAHALEQIQKNDVTRTIFKEDDIRKVLDTDVINLIRESIEYVPSAVRERQDEYGHSLVNNIENSISRYKESGDAHLLIQELVNASLLDDDLMAYQDRGLPEQFLKTIESTLQRAEDFGIRSTLLEEKSSLEASQGNDQKTFEQTVRDFQGAADNPVLQVRMILQNPDFLEMAMKQDPESVKELAALCDSMSVALSMELDHRQREDSPASPETVPSSNHRMRM